MSSSDKDEELLTIDITQSDSSKPEYFLGCIKFLPGVCVLHPIFEILKINYY